MLILYPLDKASGMSFSEKRNYIKAALNKPVWDKLFQKDFAKDLPASKFDKLLMGLCVNKMSIAIIFLIESRLLIKHLMHE
jgi:hypothetical protein